VLPYSCPRVTSSIFRSSQLAGEDFNNTGFFKQLNGVKMFTACLVVSFLCGKYWESHVRKEVKDWYLKFKAKA
jgi:hypothetical protein